jgi:hypothetical protein
VVTGKWNKILSWISPKWPGQLAEDFANETDVCRFTRNHGPLDNWSSDFAGKLAASLPPFEFREAEWRDRQDRFRLIWETMSEELTRGSERIFPAIVGVEDLIVRRTGFRLPVKGLFETVSDRLIFRAATLWELLLLDLCHVQRQRLRKCARPKCHSPYFVAEHLGARFCELEECKKWGRNQTKLSWWNANRRNDGVSATEKRGRKHGTQKAR